MTSKVKLIFFKLKAVSSEKNISCIKIFSNFQLPPLLITNIALAYHRHKFLGIIRSVTQSNTQSIFVTRCQLPQLIRNTTIITYYGRYNSYISFFHVICLSVCCLDIVCSTVGEDNQNIFNLKTISIFTIEYL